MMLAAFRLITLAFAACVGTRWVVFRVFLTNWANARPELHEGSGGPVRSVALAALGTLFNGLMGIPYMLQLAHGWTSLTVKVNMVAVGVLVPAILCSALPFRATKGRADRSSVWQRYDFFQTKSE